MTKGYVSATLQSVPLTPDFGLCAPLSPVAPTSVRVSALKLVHYPFAQGGIRFGKLGSRTTLSGSGRQAPLSLLQHRPYLVL